MNFLSRIGDPALPIGSASRVILPDLRADGCQVEYREFLGVHDVLADLLHEMMGWMTAPAA